MKKILLTIAILGLLCSCEKGTTDNPNDKPDTPIETPKEPEPEPEPETPIKAEDIPNSYWYRASYYLEYVDENGEKVYEDSNDLAGMAGFYTPSKWWYFGDNAEFIIYVYDDGDIVNDTAPTSYYTKQTYKFDLDANTLTTENGVYTIIKFTDKELIVEIVGGKYGNNTDVLNGYRMKRVYPKDGFFDNYKPYDEVFNVKGDKPSVDFNSDIR